ncbi:MAG: HAMP domain-containing histidine kinase [Cyanobacteria bacterium Co-bin13]|nr:HAMP domain-containing histidine kinase [Cyanobacteria bacterium Co-bin13]
MPFSALQKRLRLIQIRPQSTLPLSKEYLTWQQQFIQDRLRLVIWISTVFLGILAVLHLGLILPALNRVGQEDATLRNDRILFTLCVLAAQELGLLLNLLLLRSPASTRYVRLAFLGYAGAVLLVPQLQHMLIGETFLDLGGWVIFFMLQAVLIPVRWQWHLVSQLSLLSLTMLSFFVFNFDTPGTEEGMQLTIYIFFVVLVCCIFFVANLGVYLYERLLIREFELRQQLQLFLHAVSHDLRNPVTGTLMLLKNLHRNSQGEVSLSPLMIGQMIDSQERQLRLINSLLEAHVQEVQGIVLQTQPLPLAPFLQAIIGDLQLQIEQEQSHIVERVSPDLPPLMGDPLQLRRVYENMISNALQYNRSGVCITLDAQLRGRWLHCTVSDNGQGIGPIESDGISSERSIFDRYSRGISRRQPLHLGLGLHICQQIIEAHGGKIGVDSQLGQGTTFWFTLPVYAPQSDLTAQPQLPKLRC